VHAEKGPWTAEGGWEYNAVLIASTLAIVEDQCGTMWALATGVAGAAGSFAVSQLGAREEQRPGEFAGARFQGAEQVRETAQTSAGHR
jgi:putative oxidoreductase